MVYDAQVSAILHAANYASRSPATGSVIYSKNIQMKNLLQTYQICAKVFTGNEVFERTSLASTPIITTISEGKTDHLNWPHFTDCQQKQTNGETTLPGANFSEYMGHDNIFCWILTVACCLVGGLGLLLGLDFVFGWLMMMMIIIIIIIQNL